MLALVAGIILVVILFFAWRSDRHNKKLQASRRRDRELRPYQLGFKAEDWNNEAKTWGRPPPGSSG